MDNFGDHILSCRRHGRTKHSDKIRDGICNLLHEVCKTVKLISSNTMIDKEYSLITDLIPNLRPFSMSILIDHMLDETTW